MNRTLLIDSDIVAFKFASAHEAVFYFDGKDAPPAVEADFDAACAAAEEYIAELQAKLRADRIIVCLSDPSRRYFRHDIDPTYKGNRKGGRKPENLTALKEWFASKYETYQRPALEADDCMGILATHPTLVRGEKIIVSEDKDMQTVPALLFNPRTDKKPRRVSRLDADRYHLVQTIVGDTCDGYPGAVGVGPKSPEVAAVRASRSVGEAWLHVLAAFRRSKSVGPNDPEGTEAAAAVQQARLARILRASDWNFKEKRPVLWTPP